MTASKNQISNSVRMHTGPVFGDHISSAGKNSFRWGGGAHTALELFERDVIKAENGHMLLSTKEVDLKKLSSPSRNAAI